MNRRRFFRLLAVLPAAAKLMVAQRRLPTLDQINALTLQYLRKPLVDNIMRGESFFTHLKNPESDSAGKETRCAIRPALLLGCKEKGSEQ